jgi:uncharacterized membrane protein YfhO
MKILELKKDLKLMIVATTLPICIMIIVYAVIGISPFGDKSILLSDLSNEYVDYMVKYRDILLGKDSIFYSWNLGLGMNLIGVIAFYLSSPLNIVLIIFPLEYIQEAILVITLLKLGLAGGFCALFFYKSYKKDKKAIIIFSTCYSLMAYNIIYSPHIMWLDGVVLLPLVLLEIDEFVNKGNKSKLIIVLSILFISNFYTAYMIGGFSFIYYWYKVIAGKYKVSYKQLSKRFIEFSFSAVISAAISAIILLPAYMSLVREDSIDELLKFHIRYKFGDIISKIFMGSFDTMKPYGTPNIYCGLVVCIFIALYFINKKINIREKISTFGVLLMFYLSLRIDTLYMIWHGLDRPDWFEARFSFLISFFMIYIAYESFTRLEINHAKSGIIYITLVLIAVLFASDMLKTYISNRQTIVNVCFISLYFIVLLSLIKQNNKYIIIILGVIVFTELGTSALMSNLRLQREETYENRNYYIDNRQDVQNAVNLINGADYGIYRIEKDFMRRENEGMSANYKGISNFCSFYNKDVHSFLKRLGIPFESKIGRYEGTTLVTDSLLGIKYILSHKGTNSTYDLYKKENDVYIYKNSYALQFATLADKGVLNTDYLESQNPFDLQDKILSSIANKELNLFNLIKDFQVNTFNAEVSQSADQIICTKFDTEKEAYIEFEVPKNDEKELYAFIDNIDGQINIQVNGEMVSNFNGQTRKILSLENYFGNQNNMIKVKIYLLNNQVILKNNMFYSLDKKGFRDLFTNLKIGTDITEFSDTYVEINANKQSDDQILITSIPYDEGWSIKVNGKNVKPKKVFNAFIGVQLNDKESVIEMRYMPQGLVMGMVMSALGICCLITVIYIESRKK